MEVLRNGRIELSGGRVSNAWVTCPFVGNNFEKSELIPHELMVLHGIIRKDGL